MTRAQAEAIYDLGKEAVVKMLLKMDARIAALEMRLGLNSTNSSKPPSTDNKLTKPPKAKSDKRKASRGAQKGHPGKTLMQCDNPDDVEILRPLLCAQCGQDLHKHPSNKIIKRQVFPDLGHKITAKPYIMGFSCKI